MLLPFVECSTAHWSAQRCSGTPSRCSSSPAKIRTSSATSARTIASANYSIFLDAETNVLFAYLERTDDHRMDELPHHPVMLRWWDFMKDIMAANPDGSPASAPLAEVFHLD